MSVVGYNAGHEDNETDDCLGIEVKDGQAQVYIGQAYGETPIMLTVDELKHFIKDCQKVLAQLEPKPKRKRPTVYKRWDEARAAMERGEKSVVVEMDTLPFNPLNLMQLGQDMHDRERLALWKLQQEEEG
jgi:hypothetical protein